MRRALPLLAVALVSAGCGGGQRQLGGAAAHVPADADVFVAVQTSDPHWRAFARTALGRALPRVPRGADEVDLAVVGGRAVSVGAGRPAHPLANDPRYREALAAAPSGVHGVAYLSGAETRKRLLDLPGQVDMLIATFASRFRVVAHPRNTPSVAVVGYRWGAAWLTEDGYGARARSAGLPVARSQRVRAVERLTPLYTPTLFDEIPADATFVLDLPLAQGAFELLPRLPRQLARLFPGKGGAIAPALDAVLAGETALYRRPGGETTLVTSPPDTEAASEALDQLGVRLHRATFGGQLVLSTRTAGIAALRGGGPKLSADAAFRNARLPAEVAGAVYEAHRLAGWLGRDGADATLTVRYDADGR